jgi:hypothetical protein
MEPQQLLTDIVDFSPRQIKRILWSASTCLLIYTLFLTLTLLSASKYLFTQKRYTSFPILVFYICATTIQLSRMIPYLNALTMYAVAFD